MMSVEKVVKAVKERVGNAPDWAIELDTQFGSEWRASLSELLYHLDLGVSFVDLAKELGTEDTDAVRTKVFQAIRTALVLKEAPVVEELPVIEEAPHEPVLDVTEPKVRRKRNKK